jgi:hypothetical protein
MAAARMRTWRMSRADRLHRLLVPGAARFLSAFQGMTEGTVTTVRRELTRWAKTTRIARRGSRRNTHSLWKNGPHSAGRIKSGPLVRIVTTYRKV